PVAGDAFHPVARGAGRRRGRDLELRGTVPDRGAGRGGAGGPASRSQRPEAQLPCAPQCRPRHLARGRAVGAPVAAPSGLRGLMAWPSLAAYPLTTKLTSLPGTTISRTTVWPAICRATFSSVRAAASTVASSAVAGTLIWPRTLPLTWTAN